MKRLCLSVLLIALILCALPTAFSGKHTPANVIGSLSKTTSIADIVFAGEKSVDRFAIERGVRPPRWNNIKSGDKVKVPDDCAFDYSGLVSSLETFLYCEPDGTIYIGHDFARSMNNIYPMAAALGIAHEFGHHMQSQKGRASRGLSPEDAADCVAGVWFAWFNEQHKTQLSMRDVAGIAKLALNVGRQNDYDTHGSSAERALAIVVGYFGNLHTCNFYFPTI